MYHPECSPTPPDTLNVILPPTFEQIFVPLVKAAVGTTGTVNIVMVILKQVELVHPVLSHLPQ